MNNFKREIFKIDQTNFEEFALRLFYFQAEHNFVYKSYLDALSIDKNEVKKLAEIPFLPIEFFKTHKVVSSQVPTEIIFESSGTTGSQNSQHHLLDANFYKNVAKHTFEKFYGKLQDYQFLALLPSYLERANSSLVYMVADFIAQSRAGEGRENPNFSGFYLSHTQDLIQNLQHLQAKKQKIVLIGVTFALLDFAESNPMDLSDVIIMETGGMKGRRREMIREEVHEILKTSFNCQHIHSEYGMTELLSQGYAINDGIFQSPAWVKILLRDTNDPFEVGTHLRNGGMNVIDLANVDSCAFIETKDLGTLLDNERFRVLGRYDNAEVRGCNLLIA
ncbi:MAG: acyl transferase [Cytophagales bacterium]|nr:MAG: acyl transferase [Cytophagales bacterium]